MSVTELHLPTPSVVGVFGAYLVDYLTKIMVLWFVPHIMDV